MVFFKSNFEIKFPELRWERNILDIFIQVRLQNSIFAALFFNSYNLLVVINAFVEEKT